MFRFMPFIWPALICPLRGSVAGPRALSIEQSTIAWYSNGVELGEHLERSVRGQRTRGRRNSLRGVKSGGLG